MNPNVMQCEQDLFNNNFPRFDSLFSQNLAISFKSIALQSLKIVKIGLHRLKDFEVNKTAITSSRHDFCCSSRRFWWGSCLYSCRFCSSGLWSSGLRYSCCHSSGCHYMRRNWKQIMLRFMHYLPWRPVGISM